MAKTPKNLAEAEAAAVEAAAPVEAEVLVAEEVPAGEEKKAPEPEAPISETTRLEMEAGRAALARYQ